MQYFNIICSEKIHSTQLNNSDWNSKQEISNGKYLIRFDGFEEPNNGRLVLKFNLFKNGEDITKKITKGSYYCLPILFPFSNTANDKIYIPTENKIILIDKKTDEIFEFDYPEPNGLKYNYFYDNYLFLILRKSFMIIDLSLMKHHVFNEKIDFLFPFESNIILFKNHFQNAEIMNLTDYNIDKEFLLALNTKELFSSTHEIYEKKYKESQNGYLWSTGHKNVKSGKTYLIHEWELVGFDIDTQKLELGTTIPISSGLMDEKRTLWFDVENKFICINISDFWKHLLNT